MVYISPHISNTWIYLREGTLEEHIISSFFFFFGSWRKKKLRKINHGAIWKNILECGIWELKANSRKKRKYHETKFLNIGHIFGMPAFILKAIYLRVNILSLNAKIIAELVLSGSGGLHLLFMKLTSEWPLLSAFLIRTCPQCIFLAHSCTRSCSLCLSFFFFFFFD